MSADRRARQDRLSRNPHAARSGHEARHFKEILARAARQEVREPSTRAAAAARLLEYSLVESLASANPELLGQPAEFGRVMVALARMTLANRRMLEDQGRVLEKHEVAIRQLEALNHTHRGQSGSGVR